MRRSRRALHLTLGLVSLCIPLAAGPASAASAFALPAFEQRWQVDESRLPNFWGPLATAKDGALEEYAEGTAASPCAATPGQVCTQILVGGKRVVQYFDKGRMELTEPGATVTSGLLATELVRGKLQKGDSMFDSRMPPSIPIAGDPDNPTPTYAQLASTASALLAAAPAKPGSFVTAFINAQGQAEDGGGFAGVSMTPAIAGYDAPTQHNVLGVFADYRNRAGLPTIGYAISEPFRATVKVGGQQRTVLVQVFERRVLTYTDTNPDAFKVEMGNIGQHYYQWRYAQVQPPTPPPAMAAAVTGTVTYLQRSALSPDAAVAISLADVSRADAPAIVIANQMIPTNGSQVPFSFTLAYDPAKIDASHSYAVSARITAGGGQLLFISTTAYRVITQGNPTMVDIVVQPAS